VSSLLEERLVGETSAYGDENSFLRHRFVRRDTGRDGGVQCLSARQVILTPLAVGLALQ
jgi:hypothetical protein